LTAVPSPCNDICQMHAGTGFCEGCGRTIDEIVAWGRLDDAAKAMVWARLPQRREELARRLFEAAPGGASD
jgi:uncharacterized protein